MNFKKSTQTETFNLEYHYNYYIILVIIIISALNVDCSFNKISCHKRI